MPLPRLLAEASTYLAYPSENPVYGRGAAAAKAVPAGATLLTVESSDILTSNKARHLVAPILLQHLPQYLECDDFCLTLLLLILGPGYRRLQREGAQLGGEFVSLCDYFAAYNAALPPLRDLHCLLSEWNDTELQWLHDESAAQQAQARRTELYTIERDLVAVLAKLSGGSDPVVRALCAALLPAYPPVSGVGLGSQGEEGAGWSEEGWASAVFRWAAACVTSRAFLSGLDEDTYSPTSLWGRAIAVAGAGRAHPGQGASQAGQGMGPSIPLAIVPLVDMLNHEGCDEDVRPLLDMSWGASSVHVQARRAYVAGEPLHLSYGARSGRDLLENYGFILPLHANASEAAVLPLPTPASQHGVVAAVTAHLEGLELPAGPMAAYLDTLQGTTDSVGPMRWPGLHVDSVKALRACALQEEDIQALQREAEEEGVASLRSSASAATTRVLYSSTGEVVHVQGMPPSTSTGTGTRGRLQASRLGKVVTVQHELRCFKLLLEVIHSAVCPGGTTSAGVEGLPAPPPREEGELSSSASGTALLTLARRVAGDCAQAVAHARLELTAHRQVHAGAPPCRDGERVYPWDADARPGGTLLAGMARAGAAAQYRYNRAACLLGHAAHLLSLLDQWVTGEQAQQQQLSLRCSVPDLRPALLSACLGSTGQAERNGRGNRGRSTFWAPTPGEGQQKEQGMRLLYPTTPVLTPLDLLQGISGRSLRTEDALALQALVEASCRYALECQGPWADRLVKGQKCIETRQYSLPAYLLGARVAILSSPAPGGLSSHGLGSGTLVGSLIFTACKAYTSRGAWEEDEALHCVPRDALPVSQGGFGWDATVDGPSAPRYGWVVLPGSVLPLSPPLCLPLPGLQEGDRVYRSIFRLPLSARGDALIPSLWTALSEQGRGQGHGRGPPSPSPCPLLRDAVTLHRQGEEETDWQVKVWVQTRAVALASEVAHGQAQSHGTAPASSSSSSSSMAHDSTGAYVWSSSAALAQMLLNHGVRALLGRRRERSGVAVLELGCGVGTLATWAAQLLCEHGHGRREGDGEGGSALVVATDGNRDTLALAAANVQSTCSGVAVAALPLSWGPADPVQGPCPRAAAQEYAALRRAAQEYAVRSLLHSTLGRPEGGGYDLLLATDVIYVHRGSPVTATAAAAGGEASWDIADQAHAIFALAKGLMHPHHGILLFAYMPRYRDMGPAVRASAGKAGLAFRVLPRAHILSPQQRRATCHTDVRIAALAWQGETLDKMAADCGGLPAALGSEEEDGAGWDDDEAWEREARDPFASLPCCAPLDD